MTINVKYTFLQTLTLTASLCVLAAMVAMAGCASPHEEGGSASPQLPKASDSPSPPATSHQQEGGSDMAFKLTSSAFDDGQAIPRKFTGDGQDLSPPLQWSDPPAPVKSFALICDDPDAPGKTWVHWVLFNIPETARNLPEGVPPERQTPGGAIQGVNDFGNLGYGGPAPPKGHGPHRYYFKLYALDSLLSLDPGARKKAVIDAMNGHIVAETQLVGRYER